MSAVIKSLLAGALFIGLCSSSALANSGGDGGTKQKDKKTRTQQLCNQAYNTFSSRTCFGSPSPAPISEAINAACNKAYRDMFKYCPLPAVAKAPKDSAYIAVVACGLSRQGDVRQYSDPCTAKKAGAIPLPREACWPQRTS